jgi:hypothetical protein
MEKNPTFSVLWLTGFTLGLSSSISRMSWTSSKAGLHIRRAEVLWLHGCFHGPSTIGAHAKAREKPHRLRFPSTSATRTTGTASPFPSHGVGRPPEDAHQRPPPRRRFHRVNAPWRRPAPPRIFCPTRGPALAPKPPLLVRKEGVGDERERRGQERSRHW